MKITTRYAALLMVVLACVFSVSAQRSRAAVSGAEVTGTFRDDLGVKGEKFSNTLEIQALGGGKIHFAFDLVYPYKMRNGEWMVNMGTLDDTATIAADVATYKSKDGVCTITFKFVKPGTVKVTQDGSDAECGFGHNVISTGTYTKISAAKPKFENPAD